MDIDKLSIKCNHSALNCLTVFRPPFRHGNISDPDNFIVPLINDSQHVPRFNKVKTEKFVDVDNKEPVECVRLEVLVLVFLFELLFLNVLGLLLLGDGFNLYL